MGLNHIAGMRKLLIILGMPGSGKDTQIAELCNRRKAFVIRVGDLVREKAKSDPRVAKDLEEGNLADDHMVNQLIESTIDNTDEDAFIISDGFPRDIKQARWFEEFMSDRKIELENTMLLDVDEKVALERLLKRGREDDEKSIIKHRLDVFKNETGDVVDYYSRKDNFLHIDGNGTPDEVLDQIREKLTW